MNHTLTEAAQSYAAVPLTDVDSNEPYAPGAKVGNPAKEQFLASDTQEWPDLSYPKIDKLPLDEYEDLYWGVLNTVLDYQSTEGETPESELLYEQTARKLAELYRMKEVQRLRTLGAAAVSADRVELSRSRAANMSEELFGEPEVEVFEAFLVQDLQTALDARASAEPARAQRANEFLARLGLTPEEATRKVAEAPVRQWHELEDSTIEVIRGDIYTIFPELEEKMRPFTGRTQNTSPKDAQPAFDAALEGVGVAQKGWKSQLLEGSTNAAETKSGKKRVVYGDKRSDFTPQDLVTRPVHEAIHAVCHQNASEQELSHRRHALPGALPFQEGLPTVFEQIISGQKRIPGEKYFIQIGLLKGLHLPADARQEQSFRVAQEIMWRRAVLAEEGEVTPAKLAAVYKSVLRTARGNARDNRDISYFVGAQKATAFLNETAKLPQEIRLKRLRWALSGVFDPTNPRDAALYGGDPAAEYLNAA